MIKTGIALGGMVWGSDVRPLSFLLVRLALRLALATAHSLGLEQADPSRPSLLALLQNRTAARTWGGIVRNNVFKSGSGGYFGYSIAVAGHQKAFISGNDASGAAFGGGPSEACVPNPMVPTSQAFVYDHWTTTGSTLQDNFYHAPLVFLICQGPGPVVGSGVAKAQTGMMTVGQGDLLGVVAPAPAAASSSSAAAVASTSAGPASTSTDPTTATTTSVDQSPLAQLRSVLEQLAHALVPRRLGASAGATTSSSTKSSRSLTKYKLHTRSHKSRSSTTSSSASTAAVEPSGAASLQQVRTPSLCLARTSSSLSSPKLTLALCSSPCRPGAASSPLSPLPRSLKPRSGRPSSPPTHRPPSSRRAGPSRRRPSTSSTRSTSSRSTSASHERPLGRRPRPSAVNLVQSSSSPPRACRRTLLVAPPPRCSLPSSTVASTQMYLEPPCPPLSSAAVSRDELAGPVEQTARASRSLTTSPRQARALREADETSSKEGMRNNERREGVSREKMRGGWYRRSRRGTGCAAGDVRAQPQAWVEL